MDPFSHLGKISQKVDEWIRKKGGNFWFPTNFLCVLDAKFNLDYDFGIKDYLIPWSDQLMGIHSLHQKGGHNS